MTHDEMMAAIKAHQDGQEIEWRFKDGTVWSPCKNPIWNFDQHEYRVKPTKWEPSRQNGLWVSVYRCDGFGFGFHGFRYYVSLHRTQEDAERLVSKYRGRVAIDQVACIFVGEDEPGQFYELFGRLFPCGIRFDHQKGACDGAQ
jgi:hypothetical protein